jgi:hypothetical protein
VKDFAENKRVKKPMVTRTIAAIMLRALEA